MSGAFFVDLTHFLTDGGRVPRRLPPIGAFMGAIVADVSAQPHAGIYSLAVKCRRRPGHVPCAGRIRAVVDPATGIIDWGCPVCGDHGCISKWQDTPWDKSRQELPPPPTASNLDEPLFTRPAARAWAKVPVNLKIRLLNDVWCAQCGGTCSIALGSGSIERGDLVLRGTCTKCRGEVARVIEHPARLRRPR